MKTKQLILLSFTMLLLASCHNEKKEIEKTALGYIMATSNYNMDEAMPYATKETRDTTLPFFKNVIMPMVDSDFLKNNTPATASINDVEIFDDTAWVTYTKTTPLETKSGKLYLIKEDGKWLVDVILVKSDTTESRDSR